MKQISFLVFISIVVFNSCINTPEANFTWSSLNPKVGETVQFENLSENARRYSWNWEVGILVLRKTSQIVIEELIAGVI